MSCLHARDKERLLIARKRRAVIFKLRVQGVQDERVIDKALDQLDLEMKIAKEKKRKEKFIVNDPAKFSVNISQLLYESDNNEYGSINQLEQDLEGVETNFKFSKRKADKLDVAPLGPDERRTRIEKARERLRTKKIYQEDTEAAAKPILNLSIKNATPTKVEKHFLSKKVSSSKNRSSAENRKQSVVSGSEPEFRSQPGVRSESDGQETSMLKFQFNQQMQATIQEIRNMIKEKQFVFLKHLDLDARKVDTALEL